MAHVVGRLKRDHRGVRSSGFDLIAWSLSSPNFRRTAGPQPVSRGGTPPRSRVGVEHRSPNRIGGESVRQPSRPNDDQFRQTRRGSSRSVVGMVAIKRRRCASSSSMDTVVSASPLALVAALFQAPPGVGFIVSGTVLDKRASMSPPRGGSYSPLPILSAVEMALGRRGTIDRSHAA